MEWIKLLELQKVTKKNTATIYGACIYFGLSFASKHLAIDCNCFALKY